MLTEVNKLNTLQLEQMGLEVHETDRSNKPSAVSRLNCYQAEFKRLKQELQNAKGETEVNCEYSDFDDYTTSGISSDQKRRLLDNSERIERTGNMLTEGARTIIDTERLGAAVLQDLATQREGIQKTRSRVSEFERVPKRILISIFSQIRETNEDLRQSSKIMNSMIVRALRERAILFGVGTAFVVVIVFSIYHSLN